MAIQDTIFKIKSTVLESKKILLAGVAVIAIGGFYAVTRHSEQHVNKSNIPNSPAIHSSINGNENANYLNDIKKADQQRMDNSKKNNDFVMPTIIPDFSNKSDSSTMGTGDDSIEKGKREEKAPELPPETMPHIETTPVVTPKPQQVQRPKRAPKVMVDPKMVTALNKWMTEDIAKMDNFAPAVVYENRELLKQSNVEKVANNSLNMSAGSDASIRNAGNTTTGETTFDIPVAGTMLDAHFASKVDSRTPGVVLGVIDSGPYAGARVLGSFQTAQSSHKLMVSFNQMTVTWTDDNGDLRSKVLRIQAFAVDPSNLSQGMATYVNRHVLSKIGFQLATSFMQGLGQAIQQSGSTAMVTPSGGTVVSQGNRTWTQQFLQAGGNSAGQIGSTLQNLYGNVPDTIQIAQNTPFALLFVGNNSENSATTTANTQTSTPRR